jgi:hypothetical protein
MEAVNKKMHITKEEKEELIAEMARKRKFVGEIKELIDGTNFSVGTEDPNFDRKDRATIDDPNYNMTVVSPWPHKNTSTLKVKYGDSSTYANPEPHSNTMDVNRMDSTALSLTNRPKFFSHLKQTSIKYPQTSVREHSEPDRKFSSAKKSLHPHEPLFRNVPYSSGVRQDTELKDPSRQPILLGMSNSLELQTDSHFKELPIAKQMKLDYDQANRSHLTKVPGMSPDFKSTF